MALALEAYSTPRAVYIDGYALIGAVAFSSGVTQSISVAVLVRAPVLFSPLAHGLWLVLFVALALAPALILPFASALSFPIPSSPPPASPHPCAPPPPLSRRPWR